MDLPNGTLTMKYFKPKLEKFFIIPLEQPIGEFHLQLFISQSFYDTAYTAKCGSFEVADSGIQLPTPLIFNVYMYSEMADSPEIWPILHNRQEISATSKSPLLAV